MGGSKGVILISVDTLKDEEQDHSCSEGSDRTCRSKNKRTLLTGMLFNLPGSKD